MPKKLDLLLKSLLISVCLGLVQCGGESDSAKVKVYIEPKSPIVITADLDEEIKAPWYYFRVYIQNTSGRNLTLIGFKTTTFLNEPGMTEKEGGFTAGNFNYTLDSGFECNWTNFWWKDPTSVPGALVFLPYFPGNMSEPSDLYLPDPVNPNAASPVCGNGTAVFVPYSLDRPEDKSNKNYRYRVKLELQGWFGTPTDQQDRFTRQITFYTR